MPRAVQSRQLEQRRRMECRARVRLQEQGHAHWSGYAAVLAARLAGGHVLRCSGLPLTAAAICVLQAGHEAGRIGEHRHLQAHQWGMRG